MEKMIPGVVNVKPAEAANEYQYPETFSEIVFADTVSWDQEGRMTTGPVAFARLRSNGKWYTAGNWMTLANVLHFGMDYGTVAECDGPPTVSDLNAERRKLEHFRGLFGPDGERASKVF